MKTKTSAALKPPVRVDSSPQPGQKIDKTTGRPAGDPETKFRKANQAYNLKIVEEQRKERQADKEKEAAIAEEQRIATPGQPDPAHPDDPPAPQSRASLERAAAVTEKARAKAKDDVPHDGPTAKSITEAADKASTPEYRAARNAASSKAAEDHEKVKAGGPINR